MPRTTTAPVSTAPPSNGEASTAPQNGTATNRPVNPGIRPDMFRSVGTQLPEGVGVRKGGPSGGRGRQLGDATLAALRFLREHKGEWVPVGEYVKPQGPALRLSFAGYHEDGSDPTPEEEKASGPDTFPVKKNIEYKYDRVDTNFNYDPNAEYLTLFLRLTDEDWQPPKTRGPRNKPTEDSPQEMPDDES
jgi:hypothetical protein